MNRHLLVALFIFSVITSRAQTGSTEADYGPYKKNVQINISSLVGEFTVQYEQSIHKRISLSGIVNYSLTRSPDPKGHFYSIMPQLRYYMGENKKWNQGWYLSASASAAFWQYHTDGIYSTSNNVLLINETYAPSGYTYQEHINWQKRGLFIGPGFGHQWLLARNRLVLDLGIGIQRSIVLQERFTNIPVWNTWRKGYIGSGNADYHYLFSFALNIGYAF